MLLIKKKKNLSQMHQATVTTGCMFCYVESDLIVSETENLYLIRDKFPIVKDHYMIISKQHFGCMGELPSSYFSEIEELRITLVKIFKDQKFIGYEHGRAGHCVKLQGSQVTCHHFHLHYLPLNVDLNSTLLSRFPRHNLPKLQNMSEFFQRFGEYLYFEDSNRNGFFYTASSAVESHLLRTLICRASGLEHRSDWEAL